MPDRKTRAARALRNIANDSSEDGDDDDRAGTSEYGTIVPPVALAVLLTCPSCQGQVQIAAKLQARVTKDSDGTGALALRVRSPKAAHVCGQIALGLVGLDELGVPWSLEGARER